MSEEEIFDVVDDHDQVIGQASRGTVHRDKLKHRAIHIFVHNSTGKIFLQKRSMAKDCFPGKWDSSASGHLDSGEEYDECSIRELREELGVDLEERPEKLFKVNACEETGWEFVWLYRLQSEGPFELQASEIEMGDWFTPKEVDDWIEKSPEDFAPAFILLWQKVRKEPLPPNH